MAEKRRPTALMKTADDEATPSKVELQRRMEETRESISQTVDEIKDTVSEQYETVKDTVSEVMDWKEQFQKNPLVWGVGAVAVGLAVGYGIAVARQDTGGPRSGGRRRHASENESFTENVFDGLANLGQQFLLPAVIDKVKDLFGVDITQELFGHKEAEAKSVTRPRATKKRATKKAGAKKSGAKKSATKRTTSK